MLWVVEILSNINIKQELTVRNNNDISVGTSSATHLQRTSYNSLIQKACTWKEKGFSKKALSITPWKLTS